MTNGKDMSDEMIRRIQSQGQYGQSPFKQNANFTVAKKDLDEDSGDKFIALLAQIAADDAEGLKRAQKSYGNSWKKRGGVGAYMMLARKIDRMELQIGQHNFDVFKAIAQDMRSEGIIDDIRDLRRYLLLVEAEMIARGFDATHRDNG